MTRVVFYEKPGCINNTRQKKLLRGLGHELIERDLLTEMWTVGRLAEFFDGMPLAEWFNPSAPSIKSGSIDPGSLSEKAALALMVKEPLLIRRPLMDTPFGLSVGFAICRPVCERISTKAASRMVVSRERSSGCTRSQARRRVRA